MLLKEEINKYLNYCKFQKELDDKTIKACKFRFIGSPIPLATDQCFRL